MRDDQFEMLRYLQAKDDIGVVEIVWAEVRCLHYRLHIKVGKPIWENVLVPELQRLVPGCWVSRMWLGEEPHRTFRVFLYSQKRGVITHGGHTPLKDL